jgi:DNA-binding MarR family transcriptional regulator
MLYVLDFNDVVPTVQVLDRTLQHFAAGIRSGFYGASAVVVSCQSLPVRRWVELWAAAENLPIYLSQSTTSLSLIQAQPAMQLSATERATLKSVLDAGGSVTAPEIARTSGLKPSAAINRLNTLEGKGLLFRQTQTGKRPDVYVDFRAASIEYASSAMSAQAEDQP